MYNVGVSYERHIKALQVEFKKTNPNMQVVDELMLVSLAMRRQDITTNLYDLKTLFEKHPFLQLENEVCGISLHFYEHVHVHYVCSMYIMYIVSIIVFPIHYFCIIMNICNVLKHSYWKK